MIDLYVNQWSIA
uniref:Uncharacterized protein n=1 Tax=Anguilla anguilla TaxID=7936 RepID=A0A0E9VBL2_ANGAN